MTVCIGSTPLLQNIPRCLSRRSFPLGVLENVIIIIIIIIINNIIIIIIIIIIIFAPKKIIIITTIPLIQMLSTAREGSKQAWFADDAASGGCLESLRDWWDALVEKGPAFDYYPNAIKPFGGEI